MGQVTAQMIREHPALAAFQQYIQDNLQRSPNPDSIEVSSNIANDGVVELMYSAGDSVFVAQVDATQEQALALRHGRFRGRVVEWAGPVERRSAGDACRTVHTLGGEDEALFQCPSTPTGAVPPDIFSQRATWLGQWGASNYTAVEFVNLVRRWRGATAWHAQSPTMSVLRNGRSWMTPVGSNELSLAQRLTGYGSVAGAGALTMWSADHASDLLGLHPDFHANERFALGAYGTYGAMSGMTSWLNRGRPAASRLAAPSLAAGLISSALVDATLGQMWAEGSGERQALRSGAFFLPQLYRMAFGNRTVALAESRAATGVSRWGGRAVTAAFLADGAYMLYDHAAHSNRETARSNLIYRRANEMHDADRHPISWLLDGAAEMVAPTLAQRWFTPNSYVERAQQEVDSQSTDSAQRLRGYLSHALLMGPTGPATDANFYTQLNWDWLRGDSALSTITRNGRELPVDLVAAQLRDPEIHARVIQNSSHEEQIAYVQRQFRGYDLSRGDVEEIFSRIALHNAREEIRQLYYSASSEVAGLSDCFDEQGTLLPGKESQLLSQVFPEQEVSADQVLALRRVALARRILELRTHDPAGELAGFESAARQIGLIDSSGNLSGEETRFAQASLENHPPAPAPASRPPLTPANTIQGIMAYGHRG